MDNNHHGRSNLKKYRTYRSAASSNASMPSSGSQPPNTTHATAPIIPAPQTPALHLKKPSRANERLTEPALPTRAQRQTKESSQSTTSSTTSQSNAPVMLPTTYRRPAPVPSTAFQSTSGLRGAQSPILSSEQSSLQQLNVMRDQLSTILIHYANSDRSLRDLVAEVGKLSENAKQKEQEIAAKEKAKEETEKAGLKVLTLLAQRVDDVRKRVIGIENVVGVSTGQDGGKTTMIDRLQNIEMDVEEWLERVRDPDAAAIVLERRGSIQPPTPLSLSPTAPTLVRHEMAVSPIKVSFTSQAISARPPASTKVDVSTQVDTSEGRSTRPIVLEVSESGSLCVSCSKILSSSQPPISIHSINDIDMGSTTASVPSSSKGKEVERISIQDGAHQINSDDLFNTTPPARPESSCKHSDRRNENSPSTKRAVGSFSAAEWGKPPLASVEGSSRGPAVPSRQSKSYNLPPLPEGTVAALRNELLIDPYPHPLEATGLGDGLVSTMSGVVGSIEAAGRMPSPESQYEEDNMDYDEQSTPKVYDTQRLEASRLQSNLAQHAPKSTETTPVQPLAIKLSRPKLLKSVSTSTESSLTSLSSDASTSASSVEDAVTDNKGSASTKAPFLERVQLSATKPQISSLLRSPVHPASQTSNITEDEDTVMSLVMDALPTSPAAAAAIPTLSQFVNAAPPVALVSPESRKSRPINTSHSPETGDQNKNLMKLQEWYKEQRMKVLSEQNNTAAASPGVHSTNQNDSCVDHVPGEDDSIPLPPSPLFTSESATSPKGDRNPVPSGPAPYLKRLIENVEDDDVEIVPNKKRNDTPTTGSVGSLIGSVKAKEKSVPSSKRSLLAGQKKGQPSKSKTRIKKRKVSLELLPVTVDLDSEDEEDQPPLKRVRLRLKGPTSKNDKVPPAVKPKSVTIVSPLKTPARRSRDTQLRASRIPWPKIDNPVFDQFIECDSCERWYHVGCVGLQPDDIRLSATEIYRCPPCDAGIPKEALTPIKNTQANHEDAPCARTKCLCPSRTRSVKKEATFIVESFVGMGKKFVGGRGVKLVYLVKWLGYGFEDATWEEEAAMGLPNPGFFVEKFEEDARKEGIDLSQYNSQAVLLKCAIDAGWHSNCLFMKV